MSGSLFFLGRRDGRGAVATDTEGERGAGRALLERTEQPCTCQFRHWLQKSFFLGGNIWLPQNSSLFRGPPLRTLGQRFQRFSPLLVAPAALLLSQGQAKAVLTYNIFESAGNVVVETNGSIDLTGAVPMFSGNCGFNGAIAPPVALICTGNDTNMMFYEISGPGDFDGSGFTSPSSSVTGISTFLQGYTPGLFGLDPAYVSGTPIVSSATFNGQTLAGFGFTTTGLIGTWTLDGTNETVQVFLGPPSTAAVPSPLPLVGAAAAYSVSRRLRKRIAAPLITPPQA